VRWRQLHEQAERAAARKDYAIAAELEEQACAWADKPRTRDITLISAVACWYKAGNYERAEKLARRVIDGYPPPVAWVQMDLEQILDAMREKTKNG
jgi:tetratricopeptide (TPR) repeat protein